MLLITLFSAVVFAIPLSHGNRPASATTLFWKVNADFPSGQDVPVYPLDPSAALEPTKRSWIHSGYSPCQGGLGFSAGLDPRSGKLMTRNAATIQKCKWEQGLHLPSANQDKINNQHCYRGR
ncbi:hypothetical protein C8J55DRAFT_530109 [Lentinula edodes]|uniref:Uncharacterized protein n=1 Tax=Lentinula lateritia TaxID=40482 RepID=A0A9W9DDT4_9AGAR|nr:hypothetical protein C8J55DRAFT_530109 [Lentinula edodes]